MEKDHEITAKNLTHPHSKATLTILEQLAITWLGHRNCNCETPCNLC